MAHYHFNAKIVRRKDERKATQVAAYKLGEPIECRSSAKTYDYGSNSRVSASGIEAPEGSPSWVFDHEELWNAVESREVRKDAQLLRDYQLSLPYELSPAAHIRIVKSFARSIVDEFGVVVGWGIHQPRDTSDQRNIVAFLLITTRAIVGTDFGPKVREMSVRPTAINIIADHRKAWADLQNAELESAGFKDRVDHRSLAAQREEALALGGITKARELDRKPQRKRARR